MPRPNDDSAFRQPIKKLKPKRKQDDGTIEDTGLTAAQLDEIQRRLKADYLARSAKRRAV